MPRGISVGPGFDWTEARVAEAIRLWTEGLTLRQIGEALGCSRNAVLGKIHRLAAKQDAAGAPLYPGLVKREVKTPGLSADGRKAKAERHGFPKRAARPPRPIIRPAVFGPLHPGTDGAARGAAPDGPAWEALPGTVPVKIESLEAGQCKWPIGEPGSPEFGFCGTPQHAGSVYCAIHHARAYAAAPAPLAPARRAVSKADRQFAGAL